MENSSNSSTTITNSAEETILLGEKFSKTLKGGEVICLQGDLGGGKTHFTKGIAKGLGIKETITSPTFVIMKVYERGDSPALYHIDLYRMKSPNDIESLDFEDFFGHPNAITVIEWPENIPEIIPGNAIKITFEHTGENKRKITIQKR